MRYANSQRIYEEACRYMPGGVNSSLRNVEPHLVFREAAGAMVVDADGNEYIDYQAGFGPPILGHNHPAVNQRVRETLEHVDLVGLGTLELEIDVARKICEHVPSAEKVLLCGSGSEATYSAIRLARAVTGRKKLVKFQGCYHGWHDYVLRNVLSAPDKVGRRDPASAGMLDEAVDHTLVCAFNDLDDVERTLGANRGQVAALIVEPIPHNVGCLLPKPGFLQGLRELTRREGVVFILDEVITGFRHGLGGYQKIAGVIPDLTCLGKAFANGYPLAALCGRAELMDRFATNRGDVFFAGTYNGHPVPCAAALATIEQLEQPGVYEQLFQLGDVARQGLCEVMSRHGVRHTVAGFGSVFVTYFLDGPIDSYADLLRNDAGLFVSYRKALLEHGILKMPMNLKRSHLSLAHTREHVERTLEASEAVIAGLVRG